MSEETLTRILATMRSLNYRPSSLARGLATHRTATIGLLLSEIETPLFLQAVNYIEPMARSFGFNVLLSNASSLEDEKKAVNLLVEKDVEGILFLSISEYRENHHLTELGASGVPLVLINRATPPEVDQIGWDNCGAATLAVDHLAKLGHKYIAHLRGPLNRQSSEERLKGYSVGLEKNGLDFRDDYVRAGDYTACPETWQQSTQELLSVSPRPTAIIASDDIVAAVVIRAIHHAGLKVPGNISVVGIDDQPFCTFLDPALTTVQLPVINAGKRAVDLLLSRITDPTQSPRQIMLPCSLIVRESTGAPAT